MKLNTKLIIIMLSLLVLAMLTLFILNQFAQNDLVNEIQESSQEISKAVQMSIEDLTSEAETSRLTDYLLKAREKGINEINIINIEGEIIDSSDPDKIGKKRELKKLEKGIHAVRRPAGGASMLSQKPYEVVVPVIVGDEQLGYVQINMLLDNIRDIQHANFIRRLFATGMVFTVGIALTIFLARRYTTPIHNLVDDFKRVSAGDLSVTIPVESNDEIGEMAVGFNNMVEKLRERESLEKRLYEAEHLSRVGQLASGIAHEIRNPLNYISLAIDHLKTEMLPMLRRQNAAELEELTDKIKEEVRRANYMVVNFMNYGRPLKLRRTTVVLPGAAGQGAAGAAGSADRAAYHGGSADPARSAAPLDRSGTVAQLHPELCQQRRPGHAGRRHDHPAARGMMRDRCNLTFADQGSGISPDDIGKIFQPYFTTKDVGIGLGLAITERIIKEHGGEIGVESTVGKGTIFTVVLPLQSTES